MAVESEVHHESSEEYEDDEEVLDTEHIDVEMEEVDFKTQGKERCKDAFLNFSSDYEDNEADEDNDLVDEDEEGFGSEEEIDDTAGANDLDLGDVVGAGFPINDPSVKWNKMKPLLGERYESPHQLQQCLTNYAIKSGFNIKFAKCDTVRLTAKCGSKMKSQPCPFRVHASWMTQERSFQIKTLVDEHKCVRNFNISNLLSPRWLVRHFLKELIMKPNLKCKEMQSIIRTKFHCGVSWSMAYRTRCRAMTIIDGKLTEHYARVWDYCHELLRSNPGSTVQVGVTVNPDQTTYFHMMYLCFKAIKEGWKIGCRRVIGLDGSFLKGTCKGELLTAIGRDANNQVYPIAWAVVDIENKANWKWFLELLTEDLNLLDGGGFTVISDQHKGLLEATKEVLPNVEHRQCARHIYANFRKTYSRVEFKNMFWQACLSTVQSEFLRKMDDIKEVNPNAYEHLIARHPHTWCRAFFRTNVACEAVENGIVECFNAIILDARKKPLLAMFEEIRLYMMNRFYHMLQKAEKWESVVCPAAIKKMNKFGEDLRNWNVNPSGPSIFEARNGLEGYVVNLQSRVCICKLWDISGIPCVHAQCAILFTGQDPVHFISEWFNVDRFKAIYANNILHVNGRNLWPRTSYIKPLPPLARRMLGRPTLKRKRHVTESQDKYSQNKMKVTGIGRTVQCKNCLQRGHNKASYKNHKVTPEPKPKKKMGRPRLDPDISHWTRGGVRGGVRGSRGGAMGSRCGRGGNRRGVVGNIGGVVANRGGRGSKRGGRGSKRGGRGSKTFVRVEGGGGAEVEGDTVENEDDTIPEKYLFHLWKSMQDLKQSGYSIEEIKNSLSLTDSRMKQLNDYHDTIEQVIPMSMEEEYPPQTETQDGGEEIIPET
ncbi:unnamed protein product [Lactuca saligna]|uniref:SWIM-type domain-containing protein n=1 Tax=Lactuca saligna TaxID=75948 RepID=A0AA35VG78_LACSI|nr:unnamed protein product [Lactuca saligna]